MRYNWYQYVCSLQRKLMVGCILWIRVFFIRNFEIFRFAEGLEKHGGELLASGLKSLKKDLTLRELQ